jgi:hypothetical protein
VAHIKHSDLANAIDRMYEAAAYPDLWPEALRSFANSLGGLGGSIVGFSADEKLISYVSPESVEIAAAYARGGWADHNFRIQLGAPLIRAGRQFVHERMLLDRRGLDRQRIQNEFLNAFQLRSFIGFEFVPGEIGGCVERGTAEFEDWEISELERISHHIKRIGAIASARGAMFGQGIEKGLDHLRAGAILLDKRGRIVSMNARAASIRDRRFISSRGNSRRAIPKWRAPSVACCKGSALQVTRTRSARTRRSACVAWTDLRFLLAPRFSSGRRSMFSCARGFFFCSRRFRRGDLKASIACATCSG